MSTFEKQTFLFICFSITSLGLKPSLQQKRTKKQGTTVQETKRLERISVNSELRILVIWHHLDTDDRQLSRFHNFGRDGWDLDARGVSCGLRRHPGACAAELRWVSGNQGSCRKSARGGGEIIQSIPPEHPRPHERVFAGGTPPGVTVAMGMCRRGELLQRMHDTPAGFGATDVDVPREFIQRPWGDGHGPYKGTGPWSPSSRFRVMDPVTSNDPKSNFWRRHKVFLFFLLVTLSNMNSGFSINFSNQTKSQISTFVDWKGFQRLWITH